MTEMTTLTDESMFRDSDGVDVFYRRWLPSVTPRSVVVIAHGMSEHSGRYDRFARVLANRGYAVYALDHRGHGRTAQATGGGRSGPPGMDGVLDDIRQLASLAESEAGRGPVVLFGHSMGALLAQAYAERHGDELDALILSGSPGIGDLSSAAELMRGAADGGLADEPVPALGPLNEPFEPARTPYDWLSRDPAEVDAYLADPLCGDDAPVTYGFLADLMALTMQTMEPAGIAAIPSTLPILLITGEQDSASDLATNLRELVDQMQAAGLDVTALYYPDARHELLNEVNRDEVHDDVLAWIERRVIPNG